MTKADEANDYSGTSGAELMRLSWEQLRQDKELLVLPVLSAVLTSLVSSGVFGIFWTLGMVGPTPDSDGTLSTSTYIAGFAVAYAGTFVAVFFQVALSAGAMKRLDGEDPTLPSCLSLAAQRLPQIAMWSLIATTVGFILRLIAERVGIIGKLVISALSVAWGVATLFVVPIIVAERDGSIAAVSRSKSLVLKRWRQIGSAGLRFGYSFVFMPLLICVGVIALGIGMAMRYNAPHFLAFAAVGALGLIVVAVIASATGMYLRTVLYRFASGMPVSGIPRGVLVHALPGWEDDSGGAASPSSA